MEFDGQKYKQILLDTFKAFIAFCEQNNLTYYVAGGTMLGAVRHHAMIPWDDDIDVYLKREDYEKLLTLKSKIPSPYFILDMDTPNYSHPFAKWANANTTIWEVEETPCVYGVFVDIFPLDEFEDKKMAIAIKKKYEKLIYFIRHSSHVWTMNNAKMAFKEGRFIDLFTMISDTIYYKPRRKYYIEQMRLWEEKVKSLQQKGGCWLLAASGVYPPEKEIYETQWFRQIVELPFEDFMVATPIDYDAYLTCHYGDYMQLPPEDQRVSNHEHYFVDLSHHYSVMEIRAIMAAR